MIIRIAIGAVIVAGVLATSASADYLTGNPKVCAISGQPQTASYCASHAAEYTLKAFMARRTHQSAWDAAIICAATSGLVKWRCTWTNGAGTGAATVWFRATSSGWKRIVTVKT